MTIESLGGGGEWEYIPFLTDFMIFFVPFSSARGLAKGTSAPTTGFNTVAVLVLSSSLSALIMARVVTSPPPFSSWASRAVDTAFFSFSFFSFFSFLSFFEDDDLLTPSASLRFLSFFSFLSFLSAFSGFVAPILM